MRSSRPASTRPSRRPTTLRRLCPSPRSRSRSPQSFSPCSANVVKLFREGSNRLTASYVVLTLVHRLIVRLAGCWRPPSGAWGMGSTWPTRPREFPSRGQPGPRQRGSRTKS
eukprot:7679677-Pyramimonas_sp.AAC.1